MVDPSPEQPRRRQLESDVIAPCEGTTGPWLDEDRRNWRKQRHTATRCVRQAPRRTLATTGATPTVQRYVKRRREGMTEERYRRDGEGCLTLSWLAGEVQVDRGEADCECQADFPLVG